MTDFDAIHAARLSLAGELAALPEPARTAAAQDACERAGGSLTGPCPTGWGPHEATLSLLGVTGIGPSAEAAIADWIAAVRRMCGRAAA